MPLEVRGQLIRSNSRTFSTTSIYMLSVTNFYTKEPFLRSKLTSLRSEVSWYDQTRVYFQLHRSTCWASRISTQKEPFPRSEFTLALNLGILDAGRSPNAVRVHAGTTQVDFEVDCPPPADSPPGDLLITMVKETAKSYKKKWKKVKLVHISHWSDSDENAVHCEIAKLNERLSDLCFAICRFSQVRFITPSHLTHNLFFYFQ